MVARGQSNSLKCDLYFTALGVRRQNEESERATSQPATSPLPMTLGYHFRRRGAGTHDLLGCTLDRAAMRSVDVRVQSYPTLTGEHTLHFTASGIDGLLTPGCEILQLSRV